MRSSVPVITAAFVTSTLVFQPPARAFDNSWELMSDDTNQGECQLFDDMPGAGVHNEAGLLWFPTSYTEFDSDSDENRTWAVVDPEIPDRGDPVKTSYPASLYVRAAVNDGAMLKVELLTDLGTGEGEFSVPCINAGVPIGTVIIERPESHSGFVEKSVGLPADITVEAVCVTIDDDPDDALERVSALIDIIAIQHDCVEPAPPGGVNPFDEAILPGHSPPAEEEWDIGQCVDWWETFTGGNP